jgi:hypothetical protein
MIYGHISHRQRQEHEQHRQSIFAIYAKEVAKDLSVLAEKDERLLLNGLLESVKHKKPKNVAPLEPKPQPKVEITATKNVAVKAEPKAEVKVETRPVVATKPVEMPLQKKVEKGQHTLDIFFR